MAKTKADELVTIKLPRIPGEDDRVYVSVNDKSWIIKRGYEVQVPFCAYDVIRRSDIAEDVAVNFKENISKAEV